MISAELASFVQSGLSTLVGTRDAALRPEALRAVGTRVEAGGDEVTVFVPAATGARTVANLRHNGRIAVTWSRPMDHRSVQMKGAVTELRAADERDRACIERYMAALAEELAIIGLPPRLVLRVARWPGHAVRFRVQGIFIQTPGPGAGTPLAAAEGRR